jgi:hypothetical protein
MIATFRSFVKAKKPSYAQAVTSLRLVFVAMVFAQTLLALLVSVGLRLVQAPNRASPFMGIILLFMALMQLPIGAALAETFGQKSGKQGALAATLLLAVVWSSVMWFAAFAWLTGAPAWILMVFVAVFAVAYGLGLGLCGRYAQLALRPEPLEQLYSEDTDSPDTLAGNLTSSNVTASNVTAGNVTAGNVTSSN